MNSSKFIHNKNDVPDEPHWVILEFSSIHVPGDERSKTNPGHGYPARSEPIVTYRAFTNREDWEDEIRRLEGSVYSSKNYRAIYVVPAKVSQEVNVNVEIPKW